MRPVKIEPNFKPMKCAKKVREYNEDNWPSPKSNEGEPWPTPDSGVIPHLGGKNCDCRTCIPRPRSLPSPVSLPPGIPMPDQTSATWPFVLAFACAMEHKLSLNRRKGDSAGWRRSGAHALQDRLDDEVEELAEALANYGPKAIMCDSNRLHVLLEAADVANFAMMIADCVENGK